MIWELVGFIAFIAVVLVVVIAYGVGKWTDAHHRDDE